ncbi:patatin-like phospholipase family protein [Mesoterricola sediminis]|uniref:PNPLA domain-containing protein n=1 Tax=Mesoterricola sediminis TaxID=2927980 RepID=A0AA48H7J4_9BACT|nr:patatin-like phospholipase family protein [Mesoterricola sediminis]BDU78796.1 hypothetical protein METESE_37540 [Mesoterricola sediminis]
MRFLAALLAAAALAAQEPAPCIDVTVIPPDMVFTFSPRVEVPGRPKVVLALSGGGARGVAHIGVLQRMEEVGLSIDGVAGTSAGSLMGALMAGGFSGKEIEDLFARVDFNRSFLDPLGRSLGRTLTEDEAENGTLLSLRFEAGGPSFALSLREGVEIRRALEGLMTRGAYFSSATFDGLKYPLRVVATNLDTGHGKVFDRGDLVEVLRASMAVPGAFRPVVIDGQPYVDGALVENLPVLAAKRAFDAEVTVAVDVSTPFQKAPVSNFFSLAARSLDLVVERRQWESRAAASIVIRPEIETADFLDYGRSLGSLVKAGRDAFDANLPALRELLLANVPDETLPADRVAVDCVRPLDPEAQAMLGRVLPQGAPVKRRDVLVALQQLLLHGWAKQARARVAGGAVHLEVVPFGRVAAIRVEGRPRLVRRIERDVRSRFPAGEPFNPAAFGVYLSAFVHDLAVEGTPLVDVRGSGFQEATGELVIRLQEPTIRTVIVKGARGEYESVYLETLMARARGHVVHTGDLRQLLDLAQRRLHLAELRARIVAAEGTPDADLELTPVHQQAMAVDLSVGYETNLGSALGVKYRTENLGGFGLEGELSAASNRLQQQALLAIQGPVFFRFPGFAMEFWASAFRQYVENALVYPSPEVRADASRTVITTQDVGVGGYVRVGGFGKGKLELAGTWRQAAFSLGVDPRRVRHERTAELSFEWDNFDRHTFPREGLLVRSRYAIGDALPDLDPQGAFRFAYLRLRGLTTFGSLRATTNLGLDLDVEYGYGRNLPLDRFWNLGGPAFLVGSQALALQAPQFAVARFGVPVRMRGPFALSLQVVPRVDYAVTAATAGGLFSDRRMLGTGLVVRTVFSRFYVELAYGFLRQGGPGGWGPSSGSFNALIGTQPFDIWRR